MSITRAKPLGHQMSSPNRGRIDCQSIAGRSSISGGHPGIIEIAWVFGSFGTPQPPPQPKPLSIPHLRLFFILQAGPQRASRGRRGALLGPSWHLPGGLWRVQGCLLDASDPLLESSWGFLGGSICVCEATWSRRDFLELPNGFSVPIWNPCAPFQLQFASV